MSVEPFDPRRVYLHLDGERAYPIDGGEPFWRALMAASQGIGEPTERIARMLVGGWLVGTFHYDATWPSWEMHPDGDEVVMITAGAIDFRLELPDGNRTVMLRAGDAIVVPQGVWHTGIVHEPTDAFHVTFGRNTQHRPA